MSLRDDRDKSSFSFGAHKKRSWFFPLSSVLLLFFFFGDLHYEVLNQLYHDGPCIVLLDVAAFLVERDWVLPVLSLGPTTLLSVISESATETLMN